MFEQEWLNTFKIIREHAVNLVDGFGIRDGMLQSTLGHSEGGVYERILAHVQHSNPTAGMKEYPGFAKYVRPLLRAKL